MVWLQASSKAQGAFPLFLKNQTVHRRQKGWNYFTDFFIAYRDLILCGAAKYNTQALPGGVGGAS
jgi:hypothetical protein